MNGILVEDRGWRGVVRDFDLAAYEALDYAERQREWADEGRRKHLDADARLLERRRQVAKIMRRRT